MALIEDVTLSIHLVAEDGNLPVPPKFWCENCQQVIRFYDVNRHVEYHMESLIADLSADRAEQG